MTDFREQLIFAFKSSPIVVPLLALFERYIFNDWHFLISLMLLVLWDTVSGVTVSVLKGTFSPSLGLKKFALKMFAIALVISAIGIMDNATVGNIPSFFTGILDKGAFGVMMAFEGASILKNAYKIYPWEPIKELLKKLKLNRDENK